MVSSISFGGLAALNTVQKTVRVATTLKSDVGRAVILSDPMSEAAANNMIKKFVNSKLLQAIFPADITKEAARKAFLTKA